MSTWYSYLTAFTDGIQNHWGGRPYKDIISGVRYVLDIERSADPERVVAAGASYGGYMINWLQGHNNEGLFKGFVCHDGVFNTLNTFYSTEEVSAECGGCHGRSDVMSVLMMMLCLGVAAVLPRSGVWRYTLGAQSGLPAVVARAAHCQLEHPPAGHSRRQRVSLLARAVYPIVKQSASIERGLVRLSHVISPHFSYRLTESEGLSAFNTLQRRGVESKLLYFPDENHWVLDPRNSLRWHEEVLGWLQKWSAAPKKEGSKEDTTPLVFQNAKL